MMPPCLRGSPQCLGRWLIALTLGIFVSYHAPSQAGPYAHNKKEGLPQGWEYRGKKGLQGKILITKKRRKSRAPRTEDDLERYLRNNQNISPEDKGRLKRKYQRWKSLDPDRQKDLRLKLKQWQGLRPEDRRLYEQRFRQWRNLTPEQRQRIRENLDKGNRLPREEKEKIRQMFR